MTSQCHRPNLLLPWLADPRETLGETCGFKLPMMATSGGKELTEYGRAKTNERGSQMGSFKMTEHILHRVRQRGLRECDLAFVLEYGCDVADGVYLRDNDAREIIRRAKALIALATRLRRTYIVFDGEDLITTYRPARRTEKKILRTIGK